MEKIVQLVILYIYFVYVQADGCYMDTQVWEYVNGYVFSMTVCLEKRILS